MSMVLELIEAERTEDVESSVDELRLQYAQQAGLTSPDLGILLSLGKTFEDLDLVEEAVHCYSRIIAVDPNHAEAYARRGEVTFGLYVARDVDGSEKDVIRWSVSDFEKAAYLSERKLSYVRSLGLALLMLGDCERARRLISETLSSISSNGQLGDEESDLLYLLAYSELFLGQLEDSLAAFAKLAGRNGNEPEGMFGQALVYGKMGKVAESTLLRKQLSVELNTRLSRLLDSGCVDYLSLARAGYVDTFGA